MTVALEQLGWNQFFAGHFAAHAAKGLTPARVAVQHKSEYGLYSAAGELTGDLAGKLRHEATGPEQLPAAGDWVAVKVRPQETRATIHAVLPRQSSFSRKQAGENLAEQVVAANVDSVFLMMSLSGDDFSTRRLERYLVMAWESGASPVIVLNKADLGGNIDERIEEVRRAAPGVDCHAVSAATGDGVERLRPYLVSGRTVALLGSSGVGKSTLSNQLMGQLVQKVQETRSRDDKGRHTTTRRELILLPDGGLIMDTPGMREMQLWDADSGLLETFEDIEALAKRCRFRDCAHHSEPGCAVRGAAEAGELAPERLASYHKLVAELRYLETKGDPRAQAEQNRELRAIMRNVRSMRKGRPKP